MTVAAIFGTIVLLLVASPGLVCAQRDSAPVRRPPPPPATTPLPPPTTSPGLTPGSERSVTVVPRTPARDSGSFYENSWAVVIGVDDYQHPRVPKLGFAVNDARAV